MAAKKPTALEEYLRRLIRARPNDAVKLAFLNPEDADSIDGLDLALLSEVKRSGSGAVEIKLADRMKIIAALMELQRAENAEKAAGANFYEALDRAAGVLKATADGSGGDNEI